MGYESPSRKNVEIGYTLIVIYGGKIKQGKIIQTRQTAVDAVNPKTDPPEQISSSYDKAIVIPKPATRMLVGEKVNRGNLEIFIRAFETQSSMSIDENGVFKRKK